MDKLKLFVKIITVLPIVLDGIEKLIEIIKDKISENVK